MNKNLKFTTLFIGLALLLGGCDGDGAKITQGIAQMEVFDFQYRLIQKDSEDKYPVSFKVNDELGCRAAKLTEETLASVLKTRRIPTIALIPAGGFPPTTAIAEITHDMMTPCPPVHELKHESSDLVDVDPRTDARSRPGDVTIKVLGGNSNPTQLTFSIHGVQILVSTQSDGPLVTGPMKVDSIDIPAGLVGGAGGSYIYDANNLIGNRHYAEFILKEILTDPYRLVAEFSFMAKKDPEDDEILIAWDGDLVLQPNL